MSHIDMIFSGAGFCSFTGTHTLSLAEMFRLVCGHCGTAAPHRKRPLHSFRSACRWSLILVQLPGTFTKRWNPAVELCKILYLWRDSYLSTRSKLNHTGPLHTGQIVPIRGQILPAVDWMRCVQKWYVVTIVETAALLLQSCLHDPQVVVNRRRPALRNIKLLVGSEGSDFSI